VLAPPNVNPPLGKVSDFGFSAATGSAATLEGAGVDPAPNVNGGAFALKGGDVEGAGVAVNSEGGSTTAAGFGASVAGVELAPNVNAGGAGADAGLDSSTAGGTAAGAPKPKEGGGTSADFSIATAGVDDAPKVKAAAAAAGFDSDASTAAGGGAPKVNPPVEGADAVVVVAAVDAPPTPNENAGAGASPVLDAVTNGEGAAGAAVVAAAGFFALFSSSSIAA
jgi:hypothetical protein